jgi:hypothetical protein
MKSFNTLLIALVGSCVLATSPAWAQSHAPISSLKFIGEQRLPHKMDFKGTVVGGLSGIDYSPQKGEWVAISDDRSQNSPARFYTLDVNFRDGALGPVSLTNVVELRQEDGTRYPNSKTWEKQGGVVPDLESIRFDPRDQSIWYTSEGDPKLGFNPFVRHASIQGALEGEVSIPKMFEFDPAKQRGPRKNLVFEGLSFAPDGNSIWLGLEAALYQDGPVPTPDAGGMTRITHLKRDGKMIAQYAYALDAIPARPGKGKYADNGMSELLAVDDTHLLALERSGVQAADGSWKDYIRLYQVDLAGASDVSGIPALAGAQYTTAKKTLIMDLSTLGLSPLDNVEGISWGPKLPNGHDTLVLVSDDNFNKHEVTQFLAFEVIR